MSVTRRLRTLVFDAEHFQRGHGTLEDPVEPGRAHGFGRRD